MSSKDTAGRPLLFVNSDPSDGGTVPHRRAIYQHVQLKYAKWKRVEKTRKMRASVLVPNARDNNEFAGPTSQSSRSMSDESGNSSTVQAIAADNQSNIGKPRVGYSYSSGPLTILQRGNSDPFNAHALPIGPKINALMEYSRDYYLPGIQRDVNNPGLRVVRPEWAQCVAFLQDQGLAYSHFARIAAVIASDPKRSNVTEDFRTQALVFKSKSMALLRERLMESPEDPKTYNQILLLMNAELYDRNFTAATSHAAILTTLLQNGTITGDLTFLFKVVYHDTQRAAMSLTRPLFDLDRWVPDQIIPLRDLITTSIPSAVLSGAQALDLHPIIDSNPPLKQTLTVLKHACFHLLLVMTGKMFADSKIVFYGRFHMSIAMGRLINHYLDATDMLNQSGTSWNAEDDSIGYARISAAISLAILLLIRCLSRVDSVKISGNVTLFNANMLIAHRLKETLIANDWQSLVGMQGKFAEARLYALFVGAWLEQARAVAQGAASGSSPGPSSEFVSTGADLGWFNCEFAEQARAMNLYEWTEVRGVLQRFIYADVLEPNGAYWFPRTIQNTGVPVLEYSMCHWPTDTENDFQIAIYPLDQDMDVRTPELHRAQEIADFILSLLSRITSP